MKLKRFMAPTVAGLVASVIGGSASAHHSTAMFEGGKVEQFGFEGMSPSWLERHEWSSRSLNAGEKVSLTYYPLRDGRQGGFFGPPPPSSASGR